MKKLLFMLLLFAVPAFAQVTINQTTAPSVNASGATTFTASVVEGGGVTWSCPSCAGSINSSGVYTAPSTIHAKQSYMGYQLLPIDHIYNTNISSLSVNSNSATWIAASQASGAVPLQFIFSFPANVIDGSTPTRTLSFTDTPGNAGTFSVANVQPYPFFRQETGIYAGSCCDRHYISIRSDTGQVAEVYDIFSFGSSSAVSGIKYAHDTYNLPNTQGGSTDAAGLYIAPLELRAQECAQAIATSGTINHAMRVTLPNGYIAGSFIWPATANAAVSGTIPYGARFRLKASFNITGFSANAQILLTALKNYGLILADGGTAWEVPIEYSAFQTAACSAAIFEVNNGNIVPNDFEAVDESGLEAYGGSSGATSNSETVVATGITNPAHTAKQQVVLTGVTVGLPKDNINIQAGMPAMQLVGYVNGSANTGLTWTMSPTVGTLTTGGLYTPPATETVPAATTITATSSADATVAAATFLEVAPNLPDGVIRFVGACCGSGANYTDSNGKTWYHEVYAADGIANTGSGSWPMTPDITLYESDYDSFGNDLRFDIYVPNGTYSVDGKFADAQCVGPGARAIDIETMGTINYSNVDVNVAAGGCYLPVDFTSTGVVTNNLLSYVIRWHGNSTNVPAINAVSFTQISAGSVGVSRGRLP